MKDCISLHCTVLHSTYIGVHTVHTKPRQVYLKCIKSLLVTRFEERFCRPYSITSGCRVEKKQSAVSGRTASLPGQEVFVPKAHSMLGAHPRSNAKRFNSEISNSPVKFLLGIFTCQGHIREVDVTICK